MHTYIYIYKQEGRNKCAQFKKNIDENGPIKEETKITIARGARK